VLHACGACPEGVVSSKIRRKYVLVATGHTHAWEWCPRGWRPIPRPRRWGKRCSSSEKQKMHRWGSGGELSGPGAEPEVV